jgi:hypothetical protein
MLLHYIHTMYCYNTFHYKQCTKYNYILFIIMLPYRINAEPHLITLTLTCPDMENETVCKFRYIRILDTMRNVSEQRKSGYNFLVGQFSTQIDIVIQRYLWKLRYKSSDKHVHIDRKFTLNTEPFQLRLIAVLSGWCHFSDLVCFDVSKPLFCFTSLHKAHAPTLVL